MHITSLKPNNNATELTATTPKPVKPLALQLQSQKVDNVILSEKAKDLAAQQSGQTNVEEAKESLSAKTLEGTAK